MGFASSVTVGLSISLAALVGACTGPSSAVRVEATGSATRDQTDQLLDGVFVARDDPKAPRDCRPYAVAKLMLRFFDRYNHGDSDSITQFVGPDFQWFSITEGDTSAGGRSFTLRSGRELARFVNKRHIHHDRIDLMAIEVGYDAPRALGQMAFVASRKADDLKPGTGGPQSIADGKGAINCRTGAIVVTSLGMVPPGRNPPPHVVQCPPGPSTMPPMTVVACART